MSHLWSWSKELVIFVLGWVEEGTPRHVFFQRLLNRSVFKGGKSPQYCLTNVVNPSMKTKVFENAIEKTCIEASPQSGGEGAWGMHLLWTQAAGWAPKKGRQNMAFKLTPLPMLFTTRASKESVSRQDTHS